MIGSALRRALPLLAWTALVVSPLVFADEADSLPAEPGQDKRELRRAAQGPLDTTISLTNPLLLNLGGVHLGFERGGDGNRWSAQLSLGAGRTIVGSSGVMLFGPMQVIGGFQPRAYLTGSFARGVYVAGHNEFRYPGHTSGVGHFAAAALGYKHVVSRAGSGFTLDLQAGAGALNDGGTFWLPYLRLHFGWTMDVKKRKKVDNSEAGDTSE